MVNIKQLFYLCKMRSHGLISQSMHDMIKGVPCNISHLGWK